MTVGRTCSRPNMVGAVTTRSPLGSVYSPAAAALSLVQLIQDRLGGGDEGTAGRCQVETFGGADQQVGLQVALQLRNLATHCRQRQAELSACLGKASALHRREHHRHGFKTIHRPTIFRKVTSRS